MPGPSHTFFGLCRILMFEGVTFALRNHSWWFWRTLWDAGNRIWVDSVQGQCTPCFSIALAQFLQILLIFQSLRGFWELLNIVICGGRRVP